MTQESYDYIIVGAGSAGCVIANKLSADPSVSVLLVESGPPDTSPLISMPMGIGKLMESSPQHYWHFKASKGGNREDEDWVKGRTLGGSSSVNGMVYMRGMPEDYDRWERGGATGWNWETMGRCFRELENHQLGGKTWRGDRGPLKVTVPTHQDALGDAVLAAVKQAGTPIVDDINDPDNEFTGGAGRQPRTISGGKRFSAATAFLNPARNRSNLTIVTDTDVLEILFDGLRANGVRLKHKDSEREVAARREIILSAGGVNSPKLLQLAGIGPAAVLRAAGVPVRVDLAGVGRNLREHRNISHSFRLRHGGKNSKLQGLGLIGTVLRYLLFKQGPLSHCMFDLAGFVKTMDGQERPDGQFGVGLFSFGETGLAKHPGLTIFGFQLHPDSVGTIDIVSADPQEPPRIDANYLATERDRKHTVALMRMIRSIAEQPALAPYIVEEVMPGSAFQSDDELVEASFTFGTSSYHVAGTCKVGTDEMAVVDPSLKVRGVEGLRVADTSIMPDLSSNTNGPAMAIGWRAAELILADR